MSAQELGWTKSGRGKSFKVKWNPQDRNVYVSYAGWTKVGQASSAGDAMRRAEAWLASK